MRTLALRALIASIDERMLPELPILWSAILLKCADWGPRGAT